MFYILDSIKRYFYDLSTCPPNKHYTRTDNRTGRSIKVSGCWLFEFSQVISLMLELIYSHCSAPWMDRPVGLHDFYLVWKCHSFSFSTFKRLNYDVVDSWICHFKIFLPAARSCGFTLRSWRWVSGMLISFSLCIWQDLTSDAEF